METAQAAPCYQYDVEDCIPSDDIDISPLLQMVDELADQALTTASRCVNGSEPICAQAEEIALEAVALAQAAAQQCLNDSSFSCQTTVATVVALANTAVDLALGCVSQDVPACRTAFDTANQGVDTALEQADGCLNDYSSACQSARRTAEQTADMLIQLITAVADACLTDSSSVCQTTINLVYATALQQAAAVQAAARECLQDDSSLCQTAVQLAVDTGLGAVATATDLATWCLEDGGSVCQTALSTATRLVLDTQKLAQDTQRDCMYEDSSLCQMAITSAQGLAASAQATAWACVNETDPTCKTAMDAARNVVAEAGACAQELGYENIGTASTTFVGPVAAADSSDLSDNCREVNSLAMGVAELALDTATECVALTSGACAVVVTAAQALIDSLYATAQACVTETDATCKTAMDAARNVVAEAGQCAQELGYENIGTSSTTFVGPVATADDSSDLSDNCRDVNSLAMGVAELALDTATECVALTSGACAVVVTAAEALVDSLYATAQACVNETDATCETAMDAARSVVAEAGQCAQELGYENIGTASTTFVGPVATADDSSDLSDNCRVVNSLAMGVAQLVLDTATECVALTSGTCATATQAASQLITLAYDTAAACLAATEGTACSSTMSHVQAAIAAADGCAAQLVAESTLLGPTAADAVAQQCTIALQSIFDAAIAILGILEACSTGVDAACLVVESTEALAHAASTAAESCATGAGACKRLLDEAANLLATAQGVVAAVNSCVSDATVCDGVGDAAELFACEEMSYEPPCALTDGSVVAGYVDRLAREVEHLSQFAGIVVDEELQHIRLYWKGVGAPPIADTQSDAAQDGVTITRLLAPFSSQELRAARTAITADPGFDSSGIVTLAVADDGSGLTLGVAGPIEAAKSLPAVLAARVPVFIEPGAQPEAGSGTRWRDVSPFTAGANIRVSNGTNRCTTGWAVHRPNNPDLRYMLTAAHCVELIGEHWVSGRNFEMILESDVKKGTWDTALLRPAGSGNTTGTKLYVGGADTSGGGEGEYTLPVAERYPVKKGQRVCASGSYSGMRCKIKITDSDVEYRLLFNDGNRYTVHAVRAEREDGTAAQGQGDSGGPVFRVERGGRIHPAGIFSAWESQATCPANASGRKCGSVMYFTSLSRSAPDMNFEITR